MTEREFQSQVIQLASMYGWRVCHFRPARMAGGEWRTPIEGHPGFPDLVLARSGRVIFAELKLDGQEPTFDQQRWLCALGQQAVVWRPVEWTRIVAAVRGVDLSDG